MCAVVKIEKSVVFVPTKLEKEKGDRSQTSLSKEKWQGKKWLLKNGKFFFVLNELTDEAVVGAHSGAQRLQVFISRTVSHALVLHQIGDHDGGGTRHAGVAVNEATAALLPSAVDKAEAVGKEAEERSLGQVEHLDGALDYLFTEHRLRVVGGGRHRVRTNVQDVRDSEM
jgi:hypothetical protein